MKLAVLFSFILSIVHSILFYGQRKGISVFLFTITALFFFIKILQKEGKIKNKNALFISIPIIILSATYFIFNNVFFYIMNFIVILVLFFIMLIIAVLGELKPENLFKNLCILSFGPFEEINNSREEIAKTFIKKEESEETPNKHLVKQMLKSLLISLPILILILILLSTADETFAKIFNNPFEKICDLLSDTSISEIIFRIIIIFALSFYFIGIILKIVNNKLENEPKEGKKGINIQEITLSTLLTLLNLIYLIFAGVQFIHIIEQMKNPSITNFANYARTGFFQLMFVSIINFIIILISKNNKKEISAGIRKYIKIMNVALAIFTIIILITSVLRMKLYEKEYGYTFLRLMVYWIQITEVILIIPTIIYILKEKFQFFKYFLTITVTMYVIINFVNIDYIIAKGNIDRYFSTIGAKKEIDFYYLEYSTSTDAIPEIIRLLKTTDEELKMQVNEYLIYEYRNLIYNNNSWQGFNISRKNAIKELEKLNFQPNLLEEIKKNKVIIWDEEV